jgi:hypothetical protein
MSLVWNINLANARCGSRIGLASPCRGALNFPVGVLYDAAKHGDRDDRPATVELAAVGSDHGGRRFLFPAGVAGVLRFGGLS